LEHPRDKALIAMVYLLAGRITEVLKLRPDDITVEDEFMVVSLWTAKRKKGVKTRKIPVPLTHPFVHIFAEWFKQVKPNQPIFYNFWNPQKPISRVQAWKILKSQLTHICGRTSQIYQLTSSQRIVKLSLFYRARRRGNSLSVKASVARFFSSFVTFILRLPVLVGLRMVSPVSVALIFRSKVFGISFSIGMFSCLDRAPRFFTAL